MKPRKPFKCNLCNARFAQNTHLKNTLNVFMKKIAWIKKCLNKFLKHCIVYGQSQSDKKVKKSWQIPQQHQRTYLGGPASIEIPPFRLHFIKLPKTVFYEVDLVLQCSHLELLLLRKFRSERGDFNWSRFLAS